MNEAAENKQLNGLSWCKLQRGEFRSCLEPGESFFSTCQPGNCSALVPVSSLAPRNLSCFDLSQGVNSQPSHDFWSSGVFLSWLLPSLQPLSEHAMDNHEKVVGNGRGGFSTVMK